MAASRCHACRVLAPGGEVPVLGRAGNWTDWHLCGRCWGLLVLGLRTRLGDRGLNPFMELQSLRLRPGKVRAAIREGLSVVGRHRLEPRSERDAVLEQEEWLLAELEGLILDVEETAQRRVTREAWQDLRERFRQLRAEARGLRRRYPGLEA